MNSPRRESFPVSCKHSLNLIPSVSGGWGGGAEKGYTDLAIPAQAIERKIRG